MLSSWGMRNCDWGERTEDALPWASGNHTPALMLYAISKCVAEDCRWGIKTDWCFGVPR